MQVFYPVNITPVYCAAVRVTLAGISETTSTGASAGKLQNGKALCQGLMQATGMSNETYNKQNVELRVYAMRCSTGTQPAAHSRHHKNNQLKCADTHTSRDEQMKTRKPTPGCRPGAQTDTNNPLPDSNPALHPHQIDTS